MTRAAALCTCLCALPAVAQETFVVGFDGPAAPGGLAPGWELRRWSPLVGWGDFEASARVVAEEGRRVLHVKSVRSGFLVATERVPDAGRLPRASWSWKAVTLPAGASFRQRSTNDQALQILFGFEGGRVLGYIWDSTGEPGATGSGLSWREDVRVVVLRAGTADAGRWIAESRDLAADFARLFGAAPPLLKGVAVQCNSQHTGTEAAGFVGPITFSAK